MSVDRIGGIALGEEGARSCVASKKTWVAYAPQLERGHPATGGDVLEEMLALARF